IGTAILPWSERPCVRVAPRGETQPRELARQPSARKVARRRDRRWASCLSGIRWITSRPRFFFGRLRRGMTGWAPPKAVFEGAPKAPKGAGAGVMLGEARHRIAPTAIYGAGCVTTDFPYRQPSMARMVNCAIGLRHRAPMARRF